MDPLQIEISFLDQERERQEPPPCVPVDESFPERDANELARLESFIKILFRTKYLSSQVVGEKVRYDISIYPEAVGAAGKTSRLLCRRRS